MFSPRVLVNFAIFFLRTSAGVGKTGVTGVGKSLGVMGDKRTLCVEFVRDRVDCGMRLSEGATGTVFRRRTRGRGVSADRRGLLENDFGVGRTSILERDGGSVRDALDELLDEEA